MCRRACLRWIIRDNGEAGPALEQVVLPDKDQQDDRDEVIFLGEMHAVDDDTAAQQRGAVAALARVARDLPLERVLPPEFRPLFTSIGEEVPCRFCPALLQSTSRAARCPEHRARRSTCG